MDLGQQLFLFLSNPNVAYLALIVGLLMLVVAVTTPGTGVAEVIAIIALAVAAIGLDSDSSANFAGVVLIIVAFVLFIVDVTATAHGALTLGGAVALLVGSLLLFPVREGAEGLLDLADRRRDVEDGRVSVLVFSALMRWRQQKRVDDAAQNVVGARRRQDQCAAPLCLVPRRSSGQLWTISADEPIEPGAKWK